MKSFRQFLEQIDQETTAAERLTARRQAQRDAAEEREEIRKTNQQEYRQGVAGKREELLNRIEQQTQERKEREEQERQQREQERQKREEERANRESGTD